MIDDKEIERRVNNAILNIKRLRMSMSICTIVILVISLPLIFLTAAEIFLHVFIITLLFIFANYAIHMYLLHTIKRSVGLK